MKFTRSGSRERIAIEITFGSRTRNSICIAGRLEVEEERSRLWWCRRRTGVDASSGLKCVGPLIPCSSSLSSSASSSINYATNFFITIISLRSQASAFALFRSHHRPHHHAHPHRLSLSRSLGLGRMWRALCWFLFLMSK